jgi:REP element-mobilizing transposase RayT
VGAITGPAIGRVGIAHQINFFMVVTYWRRPLLTHAESRRILRSIIAQVRRAYSFQIETGVLLPEHLRCIWTLPPGDANFLKRWGLIKVGFFKQTRALFRQEAWINPSKARHRESTLWMSSIGRIGTAHPQRVYRIPVRVGGSNLKFRESPPIQRTD